MIESKKIPSIRFIDFNKNWKMCRLGEIAEIVRGSSPRPIKDPIWFSDESKIGWLRISDVTEQNGRIRFLEQRLSEAGQEKTRVLIEPHLLLSIAATVGKPVINYVQTGVHDGFLIFLNPKFDLEFVFHWLEMSRPQWQRFGQPGSQVNLNSELVKNKDIILPSNSEQKQIGMFFRNLDNLIVLQQRKYEKLKNIKKAMLENFFPNNGSRVPEIRFDGFTDNWELRKVGDLLTERNEQAPKSDEYPLMAFIANEGVAPKGERYDRSSLVSDTEIKPYKKTEFGDFIYSSNNLETGSIGLNKFGNASISPVYSIFKPTGIADSDFLGRRMVRKDFINTMIKWRQGVIYGQWRIPESDFIKIGILVPSVEEQRKIGAILNSLDNLITLHQRKYDKLQNIKKAYLGKMFV